ncbi:MAG: hypothetical protein GEU97_20950 [Actinophytocola sp.]|nr:hypothetical protein [Actinophytocola sp.]
MTAGFMIAGSAVASAAPAGTSIDPTCVEEGTAALLADPIGTLTASMADPAGTIEAEIACVKEVIGI